MLRSTLFNAVSDIGMTFEHAAELLTPSTATSSSSCSYHGRHCLWCSFRDTGTSGHDTTNSGDTKHQHPSGTDLKATGSTPRKRGLFIGINYGQSANPARKLKGCINDARNMRDLMQQEFHFTDCRLLTDDNQYATASLPTRTNIIRQIRWLTHGAKPGDILFFHYSGHGAQVPDDAVTGDETDHLDEVLVPLDETIKDDYLHRALVEMVPKDVTLIAVIDACHSGTMLDLPQLYLSKNKALLRRSRCKFLKGNIVCISASRDRQTAMDVARPNEPPYGALTNALISSVQERHLRADLSNLLHDLTAKLQHQTPCISTSDNVDMTRFYFGITRQKK